MTELYEKTEHLKKIKKNRRKKTESKKSIYIVGTKKETLQFCHWMSGKSALFCS